MVKGNVKILEGSLNKIEDLQNTKKSKNYNTSRSNGHFRK